MQHSNIERILVVGLGSIGQRHIQIARKLLPESKIAALRHKSCDDLNKAEVDACFTDIESALSFNPQVAIVANPASFHLDIATKLADSGVHLFIEKPIAHTLAGVPELISLCKAKNLVLQVGYNLRFLPSLQKFKEILLSKVIGQPLSVRCEIGQYLPSWRTGSDYREGVSAQKALGGGVLLELSHEIDYLRWLFGDVEWVKSVLRKQSNLDIDVDDTAHLIFGFVSDENGKQLIASLNMDFIRHDTTRICTVIGEQATLKWNAVSGELTIFKQGGNSWELIFQHSPDRNYSYIMEWKSFLNSIEFKKKPFVSGNDGMAVLDIIHAATLSEEENSITMLPDPKL